MPWASCYKYAMSTSLRWIRARPHILPSVHTSQYVHPLRLLCGYRRLLSNCKLHHYHAHESPGDRLSLTLPRDFTFPVSPLAVLQDKYPSKWTLSDLVSRYNNVIGSNASKSTINTVPKFQLYVTTCTDPYLNLAVEHYIFTCCVKAAKAHEDQQKKITTISSPSRPHLGTGDDRVSSSSDCGGSGSNSNSNSCNSSILSGCLHHPIILMLYVNSPCVVIGRNQNPWVEANIPGILDSWGISGSDGKRIQTPVLLLRRRSGGGTVFHDLGNVNWSVIVPAAGFTRDRHAEMVVATLEQAGARGRGVKVNERHDVVMSGGQGGGDVKLSGSAYKLTRTTALHHATMLINTELGNVKRYIDSPARRWIKGRGVASVRSPISNLEIAEGTVGFAKAVGRVWKETYGFKIKNGGDVWSAGENVAASDVAVCYVTREAAEANHEIMCGYNELRSKEWTFNQTPKFTFSIPIIPTLTLPSIGTTAPSLPPQDPENPTIPTIQITSEKGVVTKVESKIPETDFYTGIDVDVTALKGKLAGASFDGGRLSDDLRSSGIHPEAALLKWIESILGRLPEEHLSDDM